MKKPKRTMKSTPIKRGRPFKNPLPPAPAPVYSFDEYYAELVRTDDILNRAGILYVLIGNTLDVVLGRQPYFTGPITLGALQTEITHYALDTLYLLSKPTIEKEDDKLVAINLPGNIKTRILVFQNRPRPIEMFDLKFFNYDVWRIPNPFAEYERLMREVIGL